MTGIDFNRLRQEITMQQVLTQLRFQPITRSGDQLHGPCPVHRSTSPGARTFSVNLKTQRYYCHKCGSKYVAIRQHAVCVLGDRGLGKAAGKVVLPVLAERLHDKAANVRRLTLLSLSDWKAAAKPYHNEMRKLKKDKDADVRSWARYVFN